MITKEAKKIVVAAKGQTELELLRLELAKMQKEKNDLEVMLEFATEHSSLIENELHERNESTKRELEIGRQIQADFLPELLPDLTGWDLKVHFKPAKEVGGDFYDVFELPGNCLGFVIADVCDKGVGAALFMALTRSLTRVLAMQASTRFSYAAKNQKAKVLISLPISKTDDTELILPMNIFETLNAVTLTNDYIATNHYRTDMFATLFFGVLDCATGMVYYVNAGHNAPLHWGKQGLKNQLEFTGPAVGVLSNISYNINAVQLEAGDLLYLFTDGVTEAQDVKGNYYSDERLWNLIGKYVSEKPVQAKELLDLIEADIKLHARKREPSDDITMLLITRCSLDE
jgi:phosphoserine phosphatase RsbU/P